MLSFHIFLFFLSDSSDGFFRVIRSGLFERSNSLKQGKKLLSTVSEFNIHKVKMLKEMYKLLIEHFELICCNLLSSLTHRSNDTDSNQRLWTKTSVIAKTIFHNQRRITCCQSHHCLNFFRVCSVEQTADMESRMEQLLQRIQNLSLLNLGICSLNSFLIMGARFDSSSRLKLNQTQ